MLVIVILLFSLKKNNTNSKIILSHGLPQGSVLTPLLFNLYTNDVPKSVAKIFVYANDIGIAIQNKLLDNCDSAINSDLQILNEYFEQWWLTPNPGKAFHHSHKMANRCLKITFRGLGVKHEPKPKYLSITLVWRFHLSKLHNQSTLLYIVVMMPFLFIYHL